MIDLSIQQKAINAIRFLSADGVQTANSGHPGLPMGTAAIAYTIWMRHLKHNPKNPAWLDRDRFILSGGHGSMLLYSLLHLTGYALPLEELKRFRQWGSLTPGHPEFRHTPGVEVTTGPLGAGFANGVGMAIAEAHLAAKFNQPQHAIVDHYVYAIVTDGDLMEGIASEAASLAGHLQLGKLIYCYDDNRISIEGSTDLAFTEDRKKRFESYGWHVQVVEDGNDVYAIDQALINAKKDARPSIIICRTIVGFGLPTLQGTEEAHGKAPGWDELNQAKQNAGWLIEPTFHIPDDVKLHFLESVEKGRLAEAEWNQRFAAYKASFAAKADELMRVFSDELPDGWESALPVYDTDAKGIASRVASGKAINALAAVLPELMGGSADLAPSNNTWINSDTAIDAGDFSGRNIHFGVREHAMGAIANGMAAHGGIIPFCATFLVFSDYMRHAMRLAALSGYGSIWVLTHDSIGVGEDGPTHQPVEHVMSLRLIPGLTVFRPADANEVSEAWKFAIKHRQQPTVLVLTRQNLPTIDRNIYTTAEGVQNGAYILADVGDGEPEVILMASGSEVALIVDAGMKLASEGINVRMVSFPSWEVFEKMDDTYKNTVLPKHIKARVAVEAGRTLGWEKWVGSDGAIIGLDRYGASAPAGVLMKEFGFTVENVQQKAIDVLNNLKYLK